MASLNDENVTEEKFTQYNFFASLLPSKFAVFHCSILLKVVAKLI